MVLGFVLGVAIAYLLTFFHVDQTIISGVKDLIKMDIGQSGYYFLFGVIGGISRVMISGFISGLIVAFLFTLLNLDHIIMDGLKEWFKYDMTTGGYYLLFALLGTALSFLKIIRMCLKPLFFLTKKSN